MAEALSADRPSVVVTGRRTCTSRRGRLSQPDEAIALAMAVHLPQPAARWEAVRESTRGGTSLSRARCLPWQLLSDFRTEGISKAEAFEAPMTGEDEGCIMMTWARMPSSTASLNKVIYDAAPEDYILSI